MQDETLKRAFRLVATEAREALGEEPRTSLGRHKLAVARQEFLAEVEELAGEWFDEKIAALKKRKNPTERGSG